MQPRFASLLLLIVFFSLSTAGAEPPKPPTDDELREAKLYETIGEMAIRRDDLLRKFAVVLHGEGVSMGDKDRPVSSYPHVFARVVDVSRKFDLRADYMPQGHYNLGNETVDIGQKRKSRDDTSLLRGPYKESTKTVSQLMQDSSPANWFGRFPAAGHDPYDDLITGTSSLTKAGTGRGIEDALFKYWQLVKTERTLQDGLRAFWSQKDVEGVYFTREIEFSAANEMMPVRYKCKSNDITMKHYFEDVRTTWRRQQSRLLPFRIESSWSDLNDSGKTFEYTCRCYWLVGDEVPDAIFTADDHLAALLDHFKITHTRLGEGNPVNGKVRDPEPHVLPEDLYTDAPKK